jgi:hypothetical protein
MGRDAWIRHQILNSDARPLFRPFSVLHKFGLRFARDGNGDGCTCHKWCYCSTVSSVMYVVWRGYSTRKSKMSLHDVGDGQISIIGRI